MNASLDVLIVDGGVSSGAVAVSTAIVVDMAAEEGVWEGTADIMRPSG